MPRIFSFFSFIFSLTPKESCEHSFNSKNYKIWFYKFLAQPLAFSGCDTNDDYYSVNYQFFCDFKLVCKYYLQVNQLTIRFGSFLF